MYFDSLKEEKDIKRAKKLRQVSEALDESIIRLEPVIERSRIILTNEVWADLSKSEYLELELNNSIITSKIAGFRKIIEEADNEDLGDLTEMKAKVARVVSGSNQLLIDSRLAMELVKDIEESSFKNLSFSMPVKEKQEKASHESPASMGSKGNITSLKPEATAFVPSGHLGPDNPTYSSPSNPRYSHKVEATLEAPPEASHPPLNISSYPPPTHSVIKTKPTSLPYFSGERADWPEFRCVWRKLAESQYASKVQLAIELKRCCKGRAAERLKHIYITNDYAYEELWARLMEEYDDPALSVQEALNRLLTLKPAHEENYVAFVKIIDLVEGVHNQLRELGQLHAVHAVDVDRISHNLPRSAQVEWLRSYRDMSSHDKVANLLPFCKEREWQLPGLPKVRD